MDSQPLAAVVLAAGLGKRMRSRQPKVLHKLAGLPLIAHVLRALAPLAPERTVIVVGHGAGQVREVVGESYGPGGSLKVEYAHQDEQLGTGHAVQMAEPLLRDHRGPILVLYGDSPLLRTSTLSTLLVRHSQQHPALTMLTCIAPDPTGYGRVIRDAGQNLVAVTEERLATMGQRAISEVNSGVYVFDAGWLWAHLPAVELNSQGEYYLTDLIGMAITSQESKRGVVTFTLDGLEDAMGINSKSSLSQAEQVVQARLRKQWMEAGVTMFLPETVFLGVDVRIGADTVLYPGVLLEGNTQVGTGCVLGPNTHLVDSTVGDDCRVIASMLEGATVERGVTIGPYSHLRPGAHLMEGVHMGHFSYIGDSHVGENTNIGAGTVTANFSRDRTKSRTIIGKEVFIGSDTMLRAPVEVGDGAVTGLGSVVLHDVPPHTVVAGVPARVMRRLDEAGEVVGTPEQSVPVQEQPQGGS